MSILTEINRIKDAVTAIVNAIKGKGVTVPTTAKVDDLASLVSAIPTGTDTSDATATASDILLGETAYVNGEKVTGNIRTYNGSTLQTRYSRETDNGFVFDATMGGDRFVKSGDVYAEVDKADFGNTQANYVAEGHTFTSKWGFNIEGTLPIYDYSNIEAFYEPTCDTDDDFAFLGYTEQSIVEDEVYLGVPKSNFGNAKQRLVREGFTFTSSDGVCIAGTMPTYDYADMEGYVYDSDGEYAYIEAAVTENNKESFIDDFVYSKVPLADFGNVRPEYVPEGLTFTSEQGFCIEGTLPVYSDAVFDGEVDEYDDGEITVVASPERCLVDGGVVYIRVQASDFGNATASDVIAGKTFTSADGVCITGTYEAASIKTCTVNVTFSYNPRNYMISATTYANGAFSNSITRASTGASVSIPNVVCGSVLVLNGQNAFTPTWSGTYEMGGDQNSCAAIVPSNSGTYTLDIGVIDD